jgi:biotin carboxylase
VSTIVVGYGKMLLTHLDRFLPPGSVVVIEEPQVIENRGLGIGDPPNRCVREIVSARYFQDSEAVELMLRRFPPRGVEAVLPGLEYGVRMAADLAARLGLPGATSQAARLLTDKVELRAVISGTGIPSPGWSEIRDVTDLAKFASRCGTIVLKPANRHASLGVQVIQAGEDLARAWARTKDLEPETLLPNRPLSWRYIAESFLEGREYSTEALVADGQMVFFNVTEKRTAGGRHPVELGHVVPAPLPADVTDDMESLTARLIGALGFRHGMIHAEWMLCDRTPYLIECAGRAPGDSIVDLINGAYEFSLVRALHTILSGREVVPPRAATGGSAIAFLTAGAGRVTGVTGVDAARELNGILRASVSVQVGDVVRDLVSSWDRAGVVMASGPSAGEAASVADTAARLVTITTEPVPAGGGRA